MNIFEFDYSEVIIEEFKIFSSDNPPETTKLKTFLESKQIYNFNFDIKLSEIDVWEFQCDEDYIIFGYKKEICDNEHFIIKLCRRNFEIIDNDIDLSGLLATNGIQINSISFCNKIYNSDILVIFLSSHKFNHLIRYDLLLNSITDVQSFPTTSYFENCLSKPSSSVDLIIDPNESVTVVLINQCSGEQSLFCPSVSDLRSVLIDGNTMAVQVLFRFWLTNLANISEMTSNSLDFIYNGVSVGKYINFLYIHQLVMLDIIWNHCKIDNSTSSLGNQFVEQLSNLTKECINDAINILLELGIKIGIDIFQLKNNHDEIRRVFNVLCDNGNRFRKLVLASRWSLGAYKKVSPISKLKDFKRQKNPIKDLNKWNTMGKEDIMKHGLLDRQVAAMKLHFQLHFKEILTENDLIHQMKLIILSNVERCSWNDLIKLIKKLGYEPVQTLTSLCLETDVKQIRDVIFSKLNLEKQNSKLMIAKNMIDELENAFNNLEKYKISTTPIKSTIDRGDSNFYCYIQPFIDRLEKFKCHSLKNVLTKTLNQDASSQLIKLKLNWFMEYYERLTVDNDEQDMLDMVDMCLIDADYKNSLSSIVTTSENYQGHLKIWLAKWKNKNESLLVNYLTMSNNSDLIIAVLELALKINFNTITDKIINQLFAIVNSRNDDLQCTYIDRWFATNIMMHLLIDKPKLFINKLIQWCPNDLSQASELICNINQTLPIHYMCTDSHCQLNISKVSDSRLLSYISQHTISKVIHNQIMDEFPILLYFILEDSRDFPTDLCPDNDYVLQSTFHLSMAVKTNSQIQLFQSFLSENVLDFEERNYTMLELDEILYAALFAGISCSEITNSDNEIIGKVNKVLMDNDYWNLLRKRLLRPRIQSNESSNIEQYYDVNLYNFLHRCGIPLNLSESFSWQSQNQFTNEPKNHQIPTISYLEKKHHSLFEISMYSLDYVYYLSLGRPFQAYMSIIYEFSDARKPHTIAQEILKDIERSIHQIALSNIYDEKVIGSCFGLLRLIGLNPESLRCYLTLIKWIIDWHVMSIEQTNLSDSSGSQSNSDDTRKYYEVEIGKLFKLCLSKIGKKPIRKKLLKQIEDIFLSRLRSNYYTEISDIIESWNLVLYFCLLQGMEFSTELLQFYAEENEWLLFLCCAQIFGYTKDQVKLGINKFRDTCIRQHMSYIASKVEEFNTILISKREDSIQKSRKVSNINNQSRGIIPINPNITEVTLLDLGNKLNSSISKDNTKTLKKNTKFSRSILQKAAKDSLIELIFDCQLNQPMKETSENDYSIVSQIQLNSLKLLAFSLVLNHPFLVVLAYCSEHSNSDPNPESSFSTYLNYISCFILSSFPERILKEFWIKWDDTIKTEWSEDETIELILYAIKNKLGNVVADAFFVFPLKKYNCVSAFFSMITHAVDIWNPVQRESYLNDFVKKCNSLSETNFCMRDKQRSKSNKGVHWLFLNRILETGLLEALNTVQSSLGSRFVYDWLQSLTSKSGLNNFYVKQLFSFNDVHINLLMEIFTVFYDYIDFDKNSVKDSDFEKTVVPINVKSKEFIEFIENFIATLTARANSSVGYAQSRLVSNISCLINQIISEAHTFGLPYDKKDVFKTMLNSLESKFIAFDIKSENSMVDLVSMAFAGQNDKDDIIQICLVSEQDNSSSDDVLIMSIVNTVSKVNHGKTNSWRRLVIPEEWQDQIFTISESANRNTLEAVSHVNSLLNEKKWIEACSYMIENDVYVKDATYILIAMKVACGKMDPNQWPSYIKETKFDKDTYQKPFVRRRSIYTNSTTKLNALAAFDLDPALNKNARQVSRHSQASQNFLRNMLEVVCHGQVIVEYIYTIYCVAHKMTESYLTIAKGEEFDVFTKILAGTCREKIDTADMYLGVVDIDLDRLSRFLADVIVQVLRSELQTHLASTTAGIASTSIPTSVKASPINSGNNTNNSKDVCFTISPKSGESSRPSPTLKSNRNLNISTYISNSLFQDYVSKVAQRCQLRTELSTTPFTKQIPELRLMKAFYLQDLLILTSCYRRLGEILYDYYQHFSQEVFSCKEDAEFLVLMLIQCHNCFTEGGDTVGISHCLKSAKELSKALTSQSYFVLLAQLLCRIGRYGEMPYIFTALIENEHFELLLRKDMDKEGVIVPYILDYLSRYFNDDFEKIELVCLKYNCFYELAETKSKKANSLIKTLRSQSWKNSSKDTIKNNIVTIISNLLESCKNYFKVGCYKKVNENFRKAQFYKLQYKWVEDPDRIFAVGSISTPLSKSLKTSNKITFPETGFSGGVRIIDMNAEEALNFLKRISNFYTAFIIIDQLKLSADFWTELIIHHVLQNGDELYLNQFINYFGRVLSPNFVQQCSNRLDKLTVKQINKQSVNLKLLLNHCNDVFLVKRLSEKYQLNK